MNQPFKTPRKRPFKRETRLDMVSWDLHFFKDMTDHEVLGCQFFSECQGKGYYYIPASWSNECSSVDLDATHECSCRPEWYLKKMKDEYEKV